MEEDKDLRRIQKKILKDHSSRLLWVLEKFTLLWCLEESAGDERLFTVPATEPAIVIVKSKKMPHLAIPNFAGLSATVVTLGNHEMSWLIPLASQKIILALPCKSSTLNQNVY